MSLKRTFENLIPFKTSGIIMIILFVCIINFHILVLLEQIPSDMVWGGKITTHEEMVQMELISILVNILLLCVTAIKLNWIKYKLKSIQFLMWTMFILFLINTIGNIFSENETEKMIFTPITLLLSILSLRMAIEPQ